MVSSVRMSPIEGGYGSNAERAAVFKFATEYGPCCIEGDQCMHVIVTLLLSLNTIRTQEAILRALSARMLMCGLQDRDSCTLTPRSFTRLFWVIMPGRGALWHRKKHVVGSRPLDDLVEIN